MDSEFRRILLVTLRLDETSIHPEARLEDAGLDSLGIVELSIALDEDLGVIITEDEVLDAATFGKVQALIHERQQAK